MILFLLHTAHEKTCFIKDLSDTGLISLKEQSDVKLIQQLFSSICLFLLILGVVLAIWEFINLLLHVKSNLQ